MRLQYLAFSVKHKIDMRIFARILKEKTEESNKIFEYVQISRQIKY